MVTSQPEFVRMDAGEFEEVDLQSEFEVRSEPRR